MDIAVTQAKILGLIAEAFAISEDDSSLNLMREGDQEHEISLLSLFGYIKSRLEVV